MKPNVESTYIHIPFCRKKCRYCSFYSVANLSAREQYVEALLSEIMACDSIAQKTPQKTIYFGGGTPSLLSLSDFERILSCFDFDNNAEITVEINPEGIEPDYLRGLYKLGVNRLSIGVQSFDDEILKVIGRGHCADDSKRAFKQAREAGFENISIDLMYGLPGQDLNGWERDLRTALELAPEHISLYGLKIDEGCYFYKNPPKNLPDDDLQADMYLKAVEVLKAGGFKHYEISNFARKGREGHHNLNYWQLGYYNGFGAGASGFYEQGRYKNSQNLNGWQKVSEGDNSPQSLLEEEIFLGFRLLGDYDGFLGGVDAEKLEGKYAPQLKKFLETGHIIKRGKRYFLTLKGVLVSNSILCEFV